MNSERPLLEWLGCRVLVTGGAGFIGTHLVERLVSCGAQVTIADVQPNWPSPLARLRDQITYKSFDLSASNAWKKLCPEDFACIFHLAGTSYVPDSVTDPAKDFDRTLKPFLNLLEHLRQASAITTRLLLMSSAAVYGNPGKLPMEEMDDTRPLSPYGVSKLAAENYARVYANLYGLQTASGRLFSCYGPRQYKLIIYDLLKRLRVNPTHLVLLGDGRQQRDFIYVEDVAKALMHLAQHSPLTGEIYNIASGQSYSTAELAQIVCQVLGCSPIIDYQGNLRPGEPDIWVASVERLRQAGFEASVSLFEGVQSTFRWLEQVDRRL